MEQNILETNDIGIYQCIKDHLVNLQSRFYKYFLDGKCTNWSRIHFMLIRLWNYDFSLEGEEVYTNIRADTSSKVQFPWKSNIEFCFGIGGKFPHVSKIALNIYLPFATSYLCETGFSAAAAIKTKYRSVRNLKTNSKRPFKSFKTGVRSYVHRGIHVGPANSCMKRIFYSIPLHLMHWTRYCKL
jgi:hypothetical protein